MADLPTVSLLGRVHVVSMPDLAACEELLAAIGETRGRTGSARLRAFAACLGLCTRLGREAGADYAALRFDPLAYGGAVYSYLRTQGADHASIATAAVALLAPLGDAAFPRKTEVDDAMGKSAAVGVS